MKQFIPNFNLPILDVLKRSNKPAKPNELQKIQIGNTISLSICKTFYYIVQGSVRSNQLFIAASKDSPSRSSSEKNHTRHCSSNAIQKYTGTPTVHIYRINIHISVGIALIVDIEISYPIFLFSATVQCFFSKGYFATLVRCNPTNYNIYQNLSYFHLHE